MIPVVGVPYLSRPDLLEGLLDSIPEDLYEKIHVIDNSPDGLPVECLRERMVITRCHHNLGVGAAWNLVIKLNPRARWWAIFNSDIVVGRGAAERLIAAMKIHDITYLNGLAAFGIRPSCIAKVGWFDENFVPGYYEDNDYDYRCRLMGVHIEEQGPVEGHYGSAVLKSSPHYQAENGRSFPANGLYYREKWGGGVGHEVYLTPFDKGGSPRDWTLDITRLSTLSWRYE